MKRAMAITGVPGTGKTSVARIVAKSCGAALIDVNKLAEALELYSGTDGRDGAKVVRLKELEAELCLAVKEERKSRPVVVEGHLACEMRLPVQRVLVLRCEPSVLRKRLAPRGYPAEKVSKNALSEALDYCTILSEKNYGKAKVFELDTTKKTPAQSAKAAEAIFSGKKVTKRKIAWPDALMREAISGSSLTRLPIEK